MAKRETIDKITDPQVRATAHSLQDLADAMQTEKSAEQKALEAALSKTDDKAIQDVLKERIEQLESNASVDVEQALDTLSDLGTNPIDIIRSGVLKKVANLCTWNTDKENE